MGISSNSAPAAIGRFPSSDDLVNSSGIAARDLRSKPLPLCPPCVEVPPYEGDGEDIKYSSEQINIGGVSLPQARLTVHEGARMDLWQGSLDLVKCLDSEIEKGDLSFQGKKVLELSCGHALPGIFAYLKGASAVHFHDFNTAVLGWLAIPNVKHIVPNPDQIANEDCTSNAIRYFGGGWEDLKDVLPYAPRAVQDYQTPPEDDSQGGYDVILLAETFYALSLLPYLYNLVKECISRPSGAVYFSGKKHYFGAPGGMAPFIKAVEDDGAFEATKISEVSDGTPNVREVWKFSLKQN